MPASIPRVFWGAFYSTLAALIIEHFVWFLARSQGLWSAIATAQVPVIMGVVCGIVAGGCAVGARALTRDKAAGLRYVAIVALAIVGALAGTILFPSMFLYKWFTLPVIVVIVGGGTLAFTRDRGVKHP